MDGNEYQIDNGLDDINCGNSIIRSRIDSTFKLIERSYRRRGSVNLDPRYGKITLHLEG